MSTWSSVSPLAKKKAPTPNPTLATTKEKDMAVVAPQKKKFAHPAKGTGIFIGALVVPVVPAFEPEEEGIWMIIIIPFLQMYRRECRLRRRRS